MNPAARECGGSWRKPTDQISDRAKRYRAQHAECRPPGPAKCALCGSTRFLVIDHKDGDESNGDPDNLRWLCKSCNTRLGLA
ncbi:MAG TPA: HNH endonuclease signature motif containing protein, partial [Terriglobia bacterium]|nr:HNH endonuclease signature motif containing protein [Terriglobia bacterium]